MGWDEVVRLNKKKYLALAGKKLWTPQTQKPKDNPPAGLHTKLNKLTTQFNNSAGRGGGHVGGGDGKCFKYGEAGHISRNCPKPRNVGGGWKRTPPGDGEPNTKMFDGVHHTYCGVCRRWTSGSKEHMTTTHRRGPPRTGDPVPPPVAPPPNDTSVV